MLRGMKATINTGISRQSDKYLVRLPDGMRDALVAAATDAKRSMNAEVVARLASSFHTSEPNEDPLAYVRADIERIAAERGMSFRSALEALVTAALAPDAPALVYISIDPGTPVSELQDKLRSVRKLIPEDASVITDRTPPRPTTK